MDGGGGCIFKARVGIGYQAELMTGSCSVIRGGLKQEESGRRAGGVECNESRRSRPGDLVC